MTTFCQDLTEGAEGACWNHIIGSEGLSPEAVLLTEPSNLKIALGQRGRMEIQLHAYHPPWIMSSDHPLVQTAVAVCRDQLGILDHLCTWQFSTNGVSTLGTHGIPTIGFGPGEEEFAHVANEQVPTTDLITAMKFYAAFALEWSR